MQSATLSNRLGEIDLLRFVAAMMVLLYHYGFFPAATGRLGSISFPEIAGLCKYGYLGVELFFIISGFVILKSAQGRSTADFAASRIARLYPAFWVCCSITAAVCALAAVFPVTMPQYVANLTLFSGFFGVPDVDGVYWSLYVEIAFYGMIAVAILCRQIARIRLFAVGWLLLSGVSLVVEIPGFWRLGLQWAPCFVAGCIFCQMSTRRWRPADLVILAAAFVIGVIFAGVRARKLSLLLAEPFDVAVVVTIYAAFFGMMLAIASGWSCRRGAQAMSALGALTFPLYLLHQNIGIILMQRLEGHLSRYAALGLVTGLALAAAYLVNRFVEIPGAPRLRAFSSRIFAMVAAGKSRLTPDRVGPVIRGSSAALPQPAEVDGGRGRD
jgi:peptidoglycan/LPS O-acetylase OafA/YrhL